MLAMCLSAMPDALAQGKCRVIIFSLKLTYLHLFRRLLRCWELSADMTRLKLSAGLSAGPNQSIWRCLPLRSGFGLLVKLQWWIKGERPRIRAEWALLDLR